MKCVDCGAEFFVDTRNMNKCRCDNCQHEVDKNNTRKRVQRYREKLKDVTQCS
jgi:DNA-directed RNA polymerase subunit RPC12/RpoP